MSDTLIRVYSKIILKAKTTYELIKALPKGRFSSHEKLNTNMLIAELTNTHSNIQKTIIKIEEQEEIKETDIKTLQELLLLTDQCLEVIGNLKTLVKKQ